MAYIGKTPSQAVRSRYFYTATGGETSLSGADDNGDTLIFADGNYVDVYLNGVLLVASSDYNVNTVNTIAGLTALTASDIVEIVVYDTFSVFGGVFQGALSANTITADTITGDMFGSHQFKVKNIEGSTIPKGTPVYIAGHSGNDPEIAIADADDPAKMPAFGITIAAIANNNKGDVIVFGNYIGIDTSSFSVGDELYVSNTGTLVNTRPSASADKVQKIAKVIRSQSQNGQIFVMGAGRSNDVPNAITTNSINLSSTTTVDSVLDEDTMTSDSATALATQQSIKAYVDSQIGSNNELSEILTNGNTTGGNNISFANNDKAVFGAGSDLQIYHDGSNSYVQDTGTGDIIIKGDNVRLQDSAGGNLLVADTNDAVQLYYGYNQKLATTATGVDVTGGLNTTDFDVIPTNSANYYPQIGGGVDGGADAYLALSGGTSGNGNLAIQARGTYGEIKFYTGGSSGSAATTERLRIDSSGNVGIGVTPASYGRLAVMTPTANYGYFGIGNSVGGGGGVNIGSYYGTTRISYIDTVLENGTPSSEQSRLQFATIAGGTLTERMRIDSSGNVGIGTSSISPYKLRVSDSATGGVVYQRLENTGTTGSNNTTQYQIATNSNSLSISVNEQYNYSQIAQAGSAINHYVDADNHIFRTKGGSYTTMTIDSSGRVTKPYQPSWNTQSINHNDASSGFTRVGSTDNGGSTNFTTQVGSSLSNGRFTAPVAGTYWVHVNGADTSAGNAGLRIVKNGSITVSSTAYLYSVNFNGTGVSAAVYLNVNEYVEGHFVHFNSVNSALYDGSFSGFLIG